ncbi:MAG TPA: helix-turn-helix domain-containing protein [Candidatus Acidoferrum sp.]|nr:helix-turn-helix domain-containing protein [Candidatus Acidoferrum sp.]
MPTTRAAHKFLAAPSRQQIRTETTQRRLLAAAERIFARDGFEAARLEDIAAAAGYTRGALYAHFEDKEDIFFALQELWVAERIGEVRTLLESYEKPEERLRALRDQYSEKGKSRKLALLSTEFKLYALRHPKAHARLRARQRRLCNTGAGLLREIVSDLGLATAAPEEAATTALGAVAHALLLEHLVDSQAVPEESLRRLLAIIFDAVIADGSREQEKP